MLVAVVLEEDLEFPDTDVGAGDQLAVPVEDLDLALRPGKPPLDQLALESRLRRAAGGRTRPPHVERPLQPLETSPLRAPGRFPGLATRPDEPRRLHQLLTQGAVDEVPQGLAFEETGSGAVDDGPDWRCAWDPPPVARLPGAELSLRSRHPEIVRWRWARRSPGARRGRDRGRTGPRP